MICYEPLKDAINKFRASMVDVGHVADLHFDDPAYAIFEREAVG